MTTVFRGGIVGCGFFAQHHLEAWRRIPEVEIVAACDLQLERAGQAAPRAYVSAEEMLDREELDAILVCGDNATAKQRVIEIVQHIGATAYDGGPASNAYVIEGLTGVIIYLNRKYKSKHGSIKITGIGNH